MICNTIAADKNGVVLKKTYDVACFTLKLLRLIEFEGVWTVNLPGACVVRRLTLERTMHSRSIVALVYFERRLRSTETVCEVHVVCCIIPVYDFIRGLTSLAAVGRHFIHPLLLLVALEEHVTTWNRLIVPSDTSTCLETIPVSCTCFPNLLPAFTQLEQARTNDRAVSEASSPP